MRAIDQGNGSLKCSYTAQGADTSARQQVYDKLCIENGTTKVNNLDTKLFKITDEKLTEFLEHYEDSILNTKQKGKSYMIMDNFMEYFGLSREDLLGARGEAENLARDASSAIPDSKRVDVLMWLKDLQTSPSTPNLGKVDKAMVTFANKLNSISQVGDGDRTKRIDKYDF